PGAQTGQPQPGTCPPGPTRSTRSHQAPPGPSRPHQAPPGHCRPLQAPLGPTRPLQAPPGPSRPHQALPDGTRSRKSPGCSRSRAHLRLRTKPTPGLTQGGAGEFVPVKDTACICQGEGSLSPARCGHVVCHIHGSVGGSRGLGEHPGPQQLQRTSQGSSDLARSRCTSQGFVFSISTPAGSGLQVRPHTRPAHWPALPQKRAQGSQAAHERAAAAMAPACPAFLKAEEPGWEAPRVGAPSLRRSPDLPPQTPLRPEPPGPSGSVRTPSPELLSPLLAKPGLQTLAVSSALWEPGDLVQGALPRKGPLPCRPPRPGGGPEAGGASGDPRRTGTPPSGRPGKQRPAPDPQTSPGAPGGASLPRRPDAPPDPSPPPPPAGLHPRGAPRATEISHRALFPRGPQALAARGGVNGPESPQEVPDGPPARPGPRPPPGGQRQLPPPPAPGIACGQGRPVDGPGPPECPPGTEAGPRSPRTQQSCPPGTQRPRQGTGLLPA
ncbi:hypothetical protein M91_10453, partial [Bos mutus]